MVDALAAWPCLRSGDEGCTLSVVVSANAKRTVIDGLHDGALRVRLAARPVDGKANEALLAWLARALALPRRALRLAGGAAARRKRIAIAAPAGQVAAALAALCRPDMQGPGVRENRLR